MPLRLPLLPAIFMPAGIMFGAEANLHFPAGNWMVCSSTGACGGPLSENAPAINALNAGVSSVLPSHFMLSAARKPSVGIPVRCCEPDLPGSRLMRASRSRRPRIFDLMLVQIPCGGNCNALHINSKLAVGACNSTYGKNWKGEFGYGPPRRVHNQYGVKSGEMQGLASR